MLTSKKYIEGELAEKLGLKDLHRDQEFLTIENYVKLHEHLWFNDHHDYVHEGCRVGNANLLNTHCFTSARLKELYQAKWKVRGKQIAVALTLADLTTGPCLLSWMERRGAGSQAEGPEKKMQGKAEETVSDASFPELSCLLTVS
jgi:hypothetical protein